MCNHLYNFFLFQTIIESLKYITTGEVPPGCGAGGPFVHDPKLLKQPTVRGQIRLRVITAAGEKVDKCLIDQCNMVLYFS